MSRRYRFDAAEHGVAGPTAPGRWFVGAPGETPERMELERFAHRELESRYELGRVLGTGASSMLFDARDRETGRRAALRVISRPAVAAAGLEERLARAIPEVAALDHPNIVAIRQSGLSERLVWYAMEFVEGQSLADVLRDGGPIDVRFCRALFDQLASALQYAHRRGVVHGDVHPANIFLFGTGWSLIADFAVARLLSRLAAGDAPTEHRPVYVAPEEEAADLPPSPAADQYALALTLWECLTGSPPGGQQQDHALPERLAGLRPDLPGSVPAALERALRPRPSERFPTVHDFVTALSAAETAYPAVEPPQQMGGMPAVNPRLLFVEYPHRRRRSGLAAGSVAVLGVAVLALSPFIRSSREAEPPPAIPVLSPGADSVRRAEAMAPPLPGPSRDSAPLPEASRLALADSAPPEPDPAAAPAPEPQPNPPPEPRPPRTERRPAPTPARTVIRQSAGTPSVPPPIGAAPDVASPSEPGRLYISSRPWGQLFLDGRLIGNTPIAGLALPAGTHVLRVARPGFRVYEREITVVPGQQIRLIDLSLEALPP